jgi:hypothetical protein
LIAAITVHDSDAAPSRGLAPVVKTTGIRPAVDNATAERGTAPTADNSPSAEGAVPILGD